MATSTSEGPIDAGVREPGEQEDAVQNHIKGDAPGYRKPSMKGDEKLAASAIEQTADTGRHGPLGRIGELAHTLHVWVAGEPLSDRDRAHMAVIDAHNNWTNYW